MRGFGGLRKVLTEYAHFVLGLQGLEIGWVRIHDVYNVAVQGFHLKVWKVAFRKFRTRQLSAHMIGVWIFLSGALPFKVWV